MPIPDARFSGCCDWGFDLIGAVSVVEADTPWIGDAANRFYLQSGQFSSTIKTSQATSVSSPADISWDGTNTPWSGYFPITDKLYLQSGQFTSTLKTSVSIFGGGDADKFPNGISWDGTNTPVAINGVSGNPDRLILISGQFTTTIKTSLSVGATDSVPTGISWDGTDTPWCGSASDKLYLQSGQFTSTIKDSVSVGTVDTIPMGISWDGTNTPWCGDNDNKLYLQSGQFTSTLKTSESVGTVDTQPAGINTNALTVG